jgi:hypothetical protein
MLVVLLEPTIRLLTPRAAELEAPLIHRGLALLTLILGQWCQDQIQSLRLCNLVGSTTSPSCARQFKATHGPLKASAITSSSVAARVITHAAAMPWAPAAPQTPFFDSRLIAQ